MPDELFEGEMIADEGDAPEATPEVEKKPAAPKPRVKKKPPTAAGVMTLPEMLAALQNGEVLQGRSGAQISNLQGAYVTVEIGSSVRSMQIYTAHKLYVA